MERIIRDSCSGPQSSARCYGESCKERATDKMMVQWETEMTNCSQGTKGHEADRTLVFINYICMKDNGWRVMSVSGNSNGDYDGLVRRTKHAWKDETRGNKDTVVSPGALSSLADLILPCEWHSVTSHRASTVTRKKQWASTLKSGSKGRTVMALGIPYTQICNLWSWKRTME